MSNETDPQADHAALFKRVSDHLAVTAGKLSHLKGEKAQLSPFDVARLFVATGASVLLTEYGDPATVAFLREYADLIEAGKPVDN